MSDGATGRATLAAPGPLVAATWLVEHLGAPGLVVADVRWYLDARSGLAAWEAGRIPGAEFVDIDGDLAGAPAGPEGRHPLPSPETFAAAMNRAGIGDDTVVVAYDDTGGMTAARLWWMLHVLGHPVAVLDGGLSAWPGTLESGRAPRPLPRMSGTRPFAVRPWPADRMPDTRAVIERSAGLVLLDARSPERFRGDPNPVDTRLGHVPGARNAPWAANLDPTTGRFLAPRDLEARYRALGIEERTEVIVSCGSGISACADLLALEITGLGAAARLYPASYSGWSADPARPVESGLDEPGPSAVPSMEPPTATSRS